MFDRKLSRALACLAVMTTYTDVFAQGDAAIAVSPSERHRYSAAAYGMDTPCDAALPAASPGCAGVNDRCTASPPPRHVYVCPCPSCSQPRRGNPESAQQPESQSQPGAFVAPPQTGVQVSPSRQTSFGGMAIRFPEIRIGLPTIELPNRVTRTRGAHMELDSAVADYRTYPAQPAQPVQRQEYAAAPRYPAPATESARQAPESQPENAEVEDMRRRCEAMAEQLRNKEAMLDEKLSELEQQLHNLRCLPAQPVAPRHPQAAPCDTYPEPNCVPRGNTLGMLSSDGDSGYGESFNAETGEYPAPNRPRSSERGQAMTPLEQVPRPAPDHQGFQQLPGQQGSALYGIQTQNGSVKPVVATAHQVAIPAQQHHNTAPRRLPRPTAPR